MVNLMTEETKCTECGNNTFYTDNTCEKCGHKMV